MDRRLRAIGEGCDRVGERGSRGERLVECLARSLQEEICSAERLGLTRSSGADDGDLVACEVGGHDLLCDGIEELADVVPPYFWMIHSAFGSSGGPLRCVVGGMIVGRLCEDGMDGGSEREEANEKRSDELQSTDLGRECDSQMHEK